MNEIKLPEKPPLEEIQRWISRHPGKFPKEFVEASQEKSLMTIRKKIEGTRSNMKALGLNPSLCVTLWGQGRGFICHRLIKHMLTEEAIIAITLLEQRTGDSPEGKGSKLEQKMLKPEEVEKLTDAQLQKWLKDLDDAMRADAIESATEATYAALHENQPQGEPSDAQAQPPQSQALSVIFALWKGYLLKTNRLPTTNEMLVTLDSLPKAKAFDRFLKAHTQSISWACKQEISTYNTYGTLGLSDGAKSIACTGNSKFFSGESLAH